MLKKKQILNRTILNFAVIIVMYLVIAFGEKSGLMNRYVSSILVLVGINVILAVALNLTTGVLGQLALGNAGFMAVGAYASGLLTKSIGLPVEIAIPIGILFGGLVAALFGLVIGIPALRLRGDYLAIITLAFGEIIRVLITYFDFTGGATGLKKIPKLDTFNKLTVVYIVAVLTIFIVLFIGRSRHGRAIISIREDEIASEASGIPTTYYKSLAFTLSAFFTGLAGALYAHHMGTIGAEQFGFAKSVEIVVMVVMGGMGSITGSILAAVALTLFPELLKAIPDLLNLPSELGQRISQLRMLIYSLALVLIMIFRPSGLLGKKEFSLFELFRPKEKKKTLKGEN